MSKHKYDPNCVGCRPVIINASTGHSFSDDSVEGRMIERVWQTSTPEEREAFHEVTCNNSRDPETMAKGQRIAARLAQGLMELQRLQ